MITWQHTFFDAESEAGTSVMNGIPPRRDIKLLGFGDWGTDYSVKLQGRTGSGAWADISGATLSADGIVEVTLGNTIDAIQAVIAGTTGTPAISCAIVGWD